MWEPGCALSKATQKGGHNSHARNREFTVGTRVLIRDLRDPSHWNPGIVCVVGHCHMWWKWILGRLSVGMWIIFGSWCQEKKEEISSESGTSFKMTQPLTCTPLLLGKDSPQGKPEVAPPLEGGSPAKQPAEQPMILSPPTYMPTPRYPQRQRRHVERLQYS